MRRAPDEDRTWRPQTEPKAKGSGMEDLREEVRRRSEQKKLYRALSRDYPQHG